MQYELKVIGTKEEILELLDYRQDFINEPKIEGPVLGATEVVAAHAVQPPAEAIDVQMEAAAAVPAPMQQVTPQGALADRIAAKGPLSHKVTFTPDERQEIIAALKGLGQECNIRSASHTLAKQYLDSVSGQQAIPQPASNPPAQAAPSPQQAPVNQAPPANPIPAAPVQQQAAPAPQPSTQPNTGITKETVMAEMSAAVKRVISTGVTQEAAKTPVIQLLQKYAAQNLSGLNPTYYAAFVEEVRTIGAQA